MTFLGVSVFTCQPLGPIVQFTGRAAPTRRQLRLRSG